MADHIEQPRPLPRPGVPSVQAAVRADLESRELLGISRYGTPLQPHNGRDALRDAYEEALDLACYLRQALMEREETGDSQAGWDDTEQRIDGDLLADVIAEACPDLMTDYGVRTLAERALAALVRIDGVTVVRGPDSKPWQPEHALGAPELP